jgi:UDP-3-O-[3-hydroxymyristoyl] glucosamine N-acyltransferase
MPQEYSSGIRDVVFGANVKLVHPCNLYECTLGDDCFVGPFVEIQKGAIIGNSCRIQSHNFICELVTIGNDCFIGHGVMFINDTFSGASLPVIRRNGSRQASVIMYLSEAMLLSSP